MKCWIKRVESIEYGEPEEGVYWEDGFRWIKQRVGNKKSRIIDLAPHLENEHMMELLLKPDIDIEVTCQRISKCKE